MEIRQYDLYIDGVRLPPWFLPDADTQLWQRNDFTFNGCVERTNAEHDVFGELVNDGDRFDPGVPEFARLMHKLSFRLRWSSAQGVCVSFTANRAPVQWEVYGAGNEMHELASFRWQELAWGRRYVLHGENFGEPRQMTVEVRRCRVPLGELRSSALNRTRAPRQLARPRWSS